MKVSKRQHVQWFKIQELNQYLVDMNPLWCLISTSYNISSVYQYTISSVK